MERLSFGVQSTPFPPAPDIPVAEPTVLFSVRVYPFPLASAVTPPSDESSFQCATMLSSVVLTAAMLDGYYPLLPV